MSSAGETAEDAGAPRASERLAAAAFDLFESRGFDRTTVDDIAERAGVSRRTFFRHYRTKEDVVFPDHESLLARVRAHLEASSPAPDALALICEAITLVLHEVVATREVSVRRYRLVRLSPALRERELLAVERYRRLFRAYLVGRGPGDVTSPVPALQAELMSACVVAAHNHVLRRFLLGQSTDPVADVGLALAQARAVFAPSAQDDVLLLAVRAHATPTQVFEALQGIARLAEGDRS